MCSRDARTCFREDLGPLSLPPIGRIIATINSSHELRAPPLGTESLTRPLGEKRAQKSARDAAIDPVVILSRTGDGAIAQPPVECQIDDSPRGKSCPCACDVPVDDH